ncbi:general odorant-binding protein 56a-like [Haematobia irritans]|uniref:general odorant-binding protein 56a-like n=1 Tax=Haematobia irritans TaxID=7368 RepID=UPI003F4FD5F0
MKVFITLAIVYFIASATAVELTEEQQIKAKEHLAACSKEENVSEADVTKFSNKDFANPTKEFKCLSTCFFEKAGTLKDNEVQEDVVLQKLGALIGEEKTKHILEKCKGIKAEDRCETGFKIFECFQAAQAEEKA